MGVVERITQVEGLPDTTGRPYVWATVDNRTGTVFTSGMVAMDAEGKLTGGTAGEQTRVTMENLFRILGAAAVDPANVTKAVVYAVDPEDIPEINDAFGAFFPDGPPAREAPGAAWLPLGARVEISLVAVRPELSEALVG